MEVLRDVFRRQNDGLSISLAMTSLCYKENLKNQSNLSFISRDRNFFNFCEKSKKSEHYFTRLSFFQFSQNIEKFEKFDFFLKNQKLIIFFVKFAKRRSIFK